METSTLQELVQQTWRSTEVFKPNPRVVGAGYEQGLCINCRRLVYNGPTIFYEPDLDEASERTIWRHQSNGYASCMRRHEEWAEPGGVPVITLCGSTKFMEEFIEVQRTLTLENVVVISVGLFGHREALVIEDESGGPTPVKVMLDKLHFRKIDLADGIFVVNPRGYIGESTAREIDYAISKDKTVMYLQTWQD